MELAALVGEPLALDLVNTQVRTPGGPEVDLLDTPDELRSWLAEQKHRLTQPSGPVDLAAIRALRVQVGTAIEYANRGAAPPDAVLRAITDAQRAAPGYRELCWNGASVVAETRRSSDATRTLLAELADAAADLLTDPSVRKVRRCEGPGCRLLFLPAHPRRRWCSPTVCGNRVRVARYYQRHKS